MYSNYLNQLNVMQYILEMRYDKREGNITHVTTNMSIDEIKIMYEDYIFDRCKLMFNFIEIVSPTYRPKPTIIEDDQYA